MRIRSKSRNIGKAIKLAHYLARKKIGLVEIIVGSLLNILDGIAIRSRQQAQPLLLCHRVCSATNQRLISTKPVFFRAK